MGMAGHNRARAAVSPEKHHGHIGRHDRHEDHEQHECHGHHGHHGYCGHHERPEPCGHHDAACVHGKTPEARTLQDMPEGVCVRVREISGCGKLRSRLYAIGFTPGVEVLVCGQGENGCRVQVRDICVVLDRDSARSILCAPPSSGCHNHNESPEIS
ncbi:MAG: ferrous iron transport protein A [Deltaproteobacteria bacterium]|jgi:ferrous iron transport protein A|nr:ferrous iron transport protein A [Deltaproteobacteria bacterium]